MSSCVQVLSPGAGKGEEAEDLLPKRPDLPPATATEQGLGACLGAGGSDRVSDLAVPFRTQIGARDAAQRTSCRGNTNSICRLSSSCYLTGKRLRVDTSPPAEELPGKDPDRFLLLSPSLLGRNFTAVTFFSRLYSTRRRGHSPTFCPKAHIPFLSV